MYASIDMPELSPTERFIPARPSTPEEQALVDDALSPAARTVSQRVRS